MAQERDEKVLPSSCALQLLMLISDFQMSMDWLKGTFTRNHWLAAKYWVLL
jgi:hypothetical protein